MNIRICQKCGKHNLENVWSCTGCGETLSLKTLVDANNTELVSEISANIRSQIEIAKALELKAATQIKVTEKKQQNKKMPFAIYVIYVISALMTNWIFSTMTIGLIVFGIDKAGGDPGSPAIGLVVLYFINGILGIIIAIIMGVAKVYEEEFPARFSMLIFIITYFPFHIIGLYLPEKAFGSLASRVASLSVIMLFFSFIPFFHMVSQGLINMYEYVKKRKTFNEDIRHSL